MTSSSAAATPETEEILLLAVANGDRKAFRRLYDRTALRLFPICLKMMRDRDAAGDALQDAFFRIWQKAYLYDSSKGSAVAWMATVTRRCVLDRIAGAPVRTLPIDDVAEGDLGTDLDALANAPFSAALSKCFDKLDEKYAQPILLAFFHGLTHEELSRKLNAPLGTVKSWVNRGLAQLKECMG